MLDPLDLGRARRVGERAREPLGRDADDVRGGRFGDLSVPPIDADDWAELTAAVTDAGTRRVTLSLRHADGSIAPIELRLTRRHLPDVGTTGADASSEVVVAVSTDVAERLRLAERLRNRGEVLARLAAVVDEGIALIDRHGRIEELDDRFCELVDLPPHQLVDRSIFDPPVATVRRWQRRRTARRGRRPAPGRCAPERRSADVVVRLSGTGRDRPVDDELVADAAAEPVLDPTGAVDGAVLTLADRTAEVTWSGASHASPTPTRSPGWPHGAGSSTCSPRR